MAHNNNEPEQQQQQPPPNGPESAFPSVLLTSLQFPSNGVVANGQHHRIYWSAGKFLRSSPIVGSDARMRSY